MADHGIGRLHLRHKRWRQGVPWVSIGFLDALSPPGSRLVFVEDTRDSAGLDGHNSVGLPETGGGGGDGRSRADDGKGQRGRWSIYPSLAPGGNQDARRKAVQQNSRKAHKNGMLRLLGDRHRLLVGI